MTDKELLELAAKAAGLKVSRWGSINGAFLESGASWSPLTNDGDALRLAVKLSLDIMFFEGFQEVHSEHCSANHTCWEEYGEDIMASTRRAIVRSAAEIGKSMEELE